MGKPSLRHLAYEKIHAAIVEGQFPKGTVTSEGELGRMLDMSRTPVRAALQQLELEGYVRIVSKHGVIILDSSSTRTGNLLEMIAAFVLFTYHVVWASDRERLIMLAAQKTEKLRQLAISAKEDPRSLSDFEYQLLFDLIALGNNDEMEKLLASSTNRLFWNQNLRRWQAPYTVETAESLGKLIESMRSDKETFCEALFSYMRILKRTWL
jgi:DNA-binding GntR family transcriptional regulator